MHELDDRRTETPRREDGIRREDATTHRSQQQKKHYWNATNTIHTSTNNTQDPSNHHNCKLTQLKVND